MSPVLVGGPAHGNMFFDPRSDTPAPGDPSGSMPMGPPLPAAAGPAAGPPPPGAAGGGTDLAAAFDQLDDKQKFSTLMQLVASWRRGFASQQDRLLAEKATTLLQQIAANEEKATQGAMAGAADPRLLGKAYGAAGGP